MAKPNNSGWVIMTALILVVIFFLLRYLISEAAKFVPMHEYVLWALVVFQFVQLYYFFIQSDKRLRKERMGEVHYQHYMPPLYKSMIISFALWIICSGYVLILNTDSMARVVGMVMISIPFFGPGIALVFKILNYGKTYIKLTAAAFIYFRNGRELKIVWQEVEWVDYITKVMDIRRGYEKIGIVFKLFDGREIELDTWYWGLGQKDVTDLMRDIGTKMLGRV